MSGDQNALPLVAHKSTIVIVIFICSEHNEQMIKPKQDSKVENYMHAGLPLPLNRKKEKHKIFIIHN